jgi:hypothetical protein
VAVVQEITQQVVLVHQVKDLLAVQVGKMELLALRVLAVVVLVQ